MARTLVVKVIWLLSCCLSLSIQFQNENRLFDHFIEKYKKSYVKGTVVYEERKQIFQKNLGLHRDLNSLRQSNASAWYGITKFSDLTQVEFTEKYLSSYMPSESIPQPIPNLQQLTGSAKKSLPKKWDWAYSVVGQLESKHAMVTHDLQSFSVQEVLDCSFGLPSLAGCKGGNICAALQWMKTTQTVIEPLSEYPTTNKVGPCHLHQNATKGLRVTGYTCGSFIHREDDLLKTVYSIGPVAVSIDATMWNNYQGGIVQHHCGEVPDNNHAVLIVGYDLTGEIPYYIAKNSWGTDFGINGYIYLEVGKDICSLAKEVATASITT